MKLELFLENSYFMNIFTWVYRKYFILKKLFVSIYVTFVENKTFFPISNLGGVGT